MRRPDFPSRSCSVSGPCRAHSALGRLVSAALVALLTAGAPACASAAPAEDEGRRGKKVQTADDLMIVNCLLPPKVRRLGRNKTYLAPRRPIRTTAVECRVRGGEYTEPDQANLGSALKVWLPQAQAGDAEAQYYLGQMFERGLGVPPDYEAAAEWYRKAAEQGDTAAQISLGSLYESGLGVPRDGEEAIRWYRRAAGMAEDLVVLQGDEYQEMQEDLRDKTARLEETQRELDQARQEMDRLRGEIRRLDDEKAQGEQVSAARRAELEGQLAAARDRLAGLEERVRRDGSAPPTPRPQSAGPTDDRVASGSPEGGSASGPKPRPKVRVTNEFDPTALAFGNYHALVIGNSRYQHLPALATAEGDARAVADILRTRYGFEVDLRIDATRFDIMRALNDLRQKLTSKDNLLVYYSGHAHRESGDRTAYWQPVDAEAESPANWIPSELVSEHLDLVPARHVLLVADALFSGLRSRSSVAQLAAGMTDEERFFHVKLLRDKRCRLVLSSGQPSPRPSKANDAHSGFATAFVRVLRDNDGLLEASRVYRALSGELAGNGTGARPPEFAAMQWARNDVSDFFFVPRS